MKGYRFPKRDILNGGVDGNRVLVWILTPDGTTTPNSVHVWMDDRIWEDTWIWTEETVSIAFPLTKYGITVINTDYQWDDSSMWHDEKHWTEN